MDGRKFDRRVSMMFKLALPMMPELIGNEQIHILDMNDLDMLVAAGNHLKPAQIERHKDMKQSLLPENRHKKI